MDSLRIAGEKHWLLSVDCENQLQLEKRFN